MTAERGPMQQLSPSVAAGMSADADSGSATSPSGGHSSHGAAVSRIELSWQKPERTRLGWRFGILLAAVLSAGAALLVAGTGKFTLLAGAVQEDAQSPVEAPAPSTGALPPAFVQPELLRLVAQETDTPHGDVVVPDAPAAFATPLQHKSAEAIPADIEVPAPDIAQVTVSPKSSLRRDGPAKAAVNRSWTGSFFERQN